MEISNNELEDYARDCVRLAGFCDDPVVRGRLIEMAHEWMRAAVDAQERRSAALGSTVAASNIAIADVSP
jgi:hypothetical protein